MVQQLSPEEQSKHDTAVGWTFYKWTGATLVICLLPKFMRSWVGLVIAVFAALSVGFMAALFHAAIRSPPNNDFFTIPVRIVDGEDSLMADELIDRHEKETKKERSLRRR